MVDVSDGMSVTNCGELYVPAAGVVVTVGGIVSIVYSAVVTILKLSRESFAKYFSVVVVLIEIGAE